MDQDTKYMDLAYQEALKCLDKDEEIGRASCRERV